MPQAYLKSLPKQATQFIASDTRGNKLYGNKANNQWWIETDSGYFNGTKDRNKAITWFAGIKGISVAEAQSRWNG